MIATERLLEIPGAALEVDDDYEGIDAFVRGKNWTDAAQLWN